MTGGRKAVVDEAMTWLGTPWHHRGADKGGGVDCGLFLIEVFARAGLIEYPTVADYPPDWAMHRDEERYLAIVEQYCHRVEQPLPGDIVVYKVGRSYSHGGIVVEWPTIVHAHMTQGVTLSEGDQGYLAAKGRPRRFYAFNGFSGAR